MRCLIGQYLVITSAGSQLVDGHWCSWFGFWSIQASAVRDGVSDWRTVESGQTHEQFDSQALAQAQADRHALDHARLLQGDDALEPIPVPWFGDVTVHGCHSTGNP